MVGVAMLTSNKGATLLSMAYQKQQKQSEDSKIP